MRVGDLLVSVDGKNVQGASLAVALSTIEAARRRVSRVVSCRLGSNQPPEGLLRYAPPAPGPRSPFHFRFCFDYLGVFSLRRRVSRVVTSRPASRRAAETAGCGFRCGVPRPPPATGPPPSPRPRPGVTISFSFLLGLFGCI